MSSLHEGDLWWISLMDDEIESTVEVTGSNHPPQRSFIDDLRIVADVALLLTLAQERRSPPGLIDSGRWRSGRTGLTLLNPQKDQPRQKLEVVVLRSFRSCLVTKTESAVVRSRWCHGTQPPFLPR